MKEMFEEYGGFAIAVITTMFIIGIIIESFYGEYTEPFRKSVAKILRSSMF